MNAWWLQPRNQLSAHFEATVVNYASPFFVDSTPKFLGFQEVHTKEPHHKIGKSWRIHMKYPLVYIQKTMENHHVEWGKSTISTGPFSMSQTVTAITIG
jgi:hypothetical protein